MVDLHYTNADRVPDMVDNLWHSINNGNEQDTEKFLNNLWLMGKLDIKAMNYALSIASSKGNIKIMKKVLAYESSLVGNCS